MNRTRTFVTALTAALLLCAAGRAPADATIPEPSRTELPAP